MEISLIGAVWASVEVECQPKYQYRSEKENGREAGIGKKDEVDQIYE
jgi:hypothetical protein